MMGIGRIFESLWVLLPHWVVGLLAAVAVAAAIPGWRFRRSTTRIQEAVRQLVRAEPSRIPQITARIWDLAREHPELLASVVREARKRDLPRIANEGMARLERVPLAASVLAQLRAEVRREERQPARDAVGKVLRIDTMLGDNRLEAAEALLTEALVSWPEDVQLLALRARLDRLQADADQAQEQAGFVGGS